MSLLVPLVDVRSATPRSRLIQLALGEHIFTYEPGQAVLLGQVGTPARWPYSIASSPEQTGETGHIEVLVSLTEDGDSPNLPLVPGVDLDLEGPLGDFTLRDALDWSRLLFVAGGSGIAPLRSMMDHALRTSSGHGISVLYSARSRNEFAFSSELQAHAGAGRIELHQTVTRDAPGEWRGSRGRITRSHFDKVLHEPEATQCFVCGPPAMVRESVDTLTRLGVPPALVHYEQWGA